MAACSTTLFRIDQELFGEPCFGVTLPACTVRLCTTKLLTVEDTVIVGIL